MSQSIVSTGNSKLKFWGIRTDELLTHLQVTSEGLTSTEACERLERYGPNLLRAKKKSDPLTLLLNQFKSPIILLLTFAAALSFYLGETTDALIIMAILLLSGLLGFWQEHRAANAVDKLLAIVQITATVLRDGGEQEIPVEEVVPGDIVILKAGDVIPGDCRILSSKDLFVDEATLTGETYPVEKANEAQPLPEAAILSKRANSLFMGTHVVSGTAKAMVVCTGKDTEFGQVSERLRLRPPETEFERGIRRYGYLLVYVTLIMVIAVFAVNVYFRRPILESFMFALALAVGLTPQLLPAIISIVLAQGAMRMASEKVIVRRLASIQNFGSMDILCSDKTGTLTEGTVKVHSILDVAGNQSDQVRLHAYLNARYQTGYTNPIDEAIRTYCPVDISAFKKLDEIPYDFLRKRLSILVSKDGMHRIITKGALQNVLSVCSIAQQPNGAIIDIVNIKEAIQQHVESLSDEGFRVLGVAYRDIDASTITRADERDMIFLGLLVLYDPPKPQADETVKQLKQLGVSLKIITGDNHLAATYISQQMGIPDAKVLSGPELDEIDNEALLPCVNNVDIFAEVEPNQKERIIIALQKAGHVVGFLGDGINDASALNAADVGISVDTAMDVAKEAADIVLLQSDLEVIARGVREGRKTFANTLKYICITTSANFGNMFSMAGVSLFLPFLPLLPKQILLNNFLTDFPAMTIAADSVDHELIDIPRRWNIQFIRNFMIAFGLISSVFDFLTFGALLFILKANEMQFHTGWFLESALTEILVLLVIRTRRPFFRSNPGKYLLSASIIVALVTILLPYLPWSDLLEFTPLPWIYLLVLVGITALYIVTSEITKKFFYQRNS